MALAVEQAARAGEIVQIILGKAASKLMVVQAVVRLRLPSDVGRFCHRDRGDWGRDGSRLDRAFGRAAVTGRYVVGLVRQDTEGGG